MITLQHLLLVAVTAALFLQGVRNCLWSLTKEQRRFEAITNRGLITHMVTGSVRIILFGGLIAYASRAVPHTLAWQMLGLAVVVLGCATFLVSGFGRIKIPALGQMPSDALLSKRVRARRLSGALFVFGSFVWAWNGAALIIQ